MSTVVAPAPRLRGPAELPDGPREPLRITALVWRLGETPLPALEDAHRYLSVARCRDLFDRTPGIEELAVVRTCHRIELYALLASRAAEEALVQGVADAAIAPVRLEGSRAIHHVYRVAAGLESLAFGEAEVRGQVRRSVGAVLSRHPRPVLRRLLAGASEAADGAASPPSSHSMAAIAATRVLETAGAPFPRVLVVGTGTVGRRAAEVLSESARLTLVYHHSAPDPAFLRATGSRAVPLDQLRPEIALSDAVITAAKAGGRLIGEEDLPRDRRARVVVDLGLPRNVDPEVRAVPGVRLFDLEDLRATAPPPPASPRPLEEAIGHRAAEAVAAFERYSFEPWVARLARQAEAMRREEVATARRFFSELSPSELAAVEQLTERLVRRLLREPLDRLRGLSGDFKDTDLRRRLLELYGASLAPP